MLVVLLPAALPSLVVRTASPVAPFCARSPAPAPRASGCVLAERPRRREAIFLAGLPGSGKTRVIKQRFGFTRDDASVLSPGIARKQDASLPSSQAYPSALAAPTLARD